MLAKGSTQAIAGVLLDHDLSDSPLTPHDLVLSTSNLMPVLVRRLPRTAPVLIHSHNASKPVVMQRMLQTAGFSVTRMRFATLTQQSFEHWLDEVRDTGTRRPTDSAPSNTGRKHTANEAASFM